MALEFKWRAEELRPGGELIIEVLVNKTEIWVDVKYPFESSYPVLDIYGEAEEIAALDHEMIEDIVRARYGAAL